MEPSKQLRTKRNRKLKPVHKGKKLPENVRLRLQLNRANKRIEKLEEKLARGWRSQEGDKDWCDITYAAGYLGKSKQTLYNNRNDRVGPPSFGSGRNIRYKVSLLDAFLETGYSQRDYDRDHKDGAPNSS